MIKNKFEINGQMVGDGEPPYIIAELSANHNGSLEKALDILVQSKARGANAVKLQSYTPDTITLKADTDDFKILEGIWKGYTLYDLYAEAHMPWDWHKPLFEKAEEIDLTLFSSPFDASAVDLLEDLNCPAYKIASFEILDHQLISYAASTGKPLIISTGMADFDEINKAFEVALEAGASSVALLHCVSGYPAPAIDYNLKTLQHMKEHFNCPIGLSDHTLNNATAIASVALGANIIEKHVTLDRNDGGVDSAFSLEMSEFEQLCFQSKLAWESIGAVNYDKKPSEKSNVKFRRSLYFVKDLKPGQKVKNEDVRSVRPGYGLSPSNLSRVIGSVVREHVYANTPVTADSLIFK